MSLYRLGGAIGMAAPSKNTWRDSITAVDVYDLDDDAARQRIFGASGLIISGMADHLILARYRTELTAFVRDGGRVLVNGQVIVEFIEGLARWSRLEYRNSADVRPHGLASHPVFDGIDYQDLHYRTGVPGVHDYTELERIGVAGFYGRGYHTNLPESASVVTGIGPLSLPLDYSFPLGAGEVLVHGGLDLDGFCDEHYSSVNLGPNLVAWLEGGARGVQGNSAKGNSAHEGVNA